VTRLSIPGIPGRDGADSSLPWPTEPVFKETPGSRRVFYDGPHISAVGTPIRRPNLHWHAPGPREPFISPFRRQVKITVLAGRQLRPSSYSKPSRDFWSYCSVGETPN